LKLRRFWFEFNSDDDNLPFGMRLGCGVTAWNYDDALNIIKNKTLTKDLPKIKKVIEGIDLSTLDINHILVNISSPSNLRGIWYPGGYT
jgi:hypothetical protein